MVQPFAGDLIDKTAIDRRLFLSLAALLTALSASAVMFVREGNSQHVFIFITKIIEGIASSFIGPSLAALTLSSFGPSHFDAVMAVNILWGHLGSVVAAILAGIVSFVLYPDIKYCFLVIGGSALLALVFVRFLPVGDPLMGRGFPGQTCLDEDGHLEQLDDDNLIRPDKDERVPKASAYLEVFGDTRCLILSCTGFFFHFANANVLLVLGEMMGGDGEGGSPKRSAVPLIAGAIVTAQVTMAVATYFGDRLTLLGVGRKPLFLAGLASLPFRCALIIIWRNMGNAWLLSTQILDGLGGGFLGLIHPFLVADITFGTGRFNVVSKSMTR